MHEVFAPHLGRTIKLGGRLVPKTRPVKLEFKDYVQAAQLPAPPDSCDYSAGGQPALADIFLNDQLGCCVIAGSAHFVALATGNAGSLFKYSDAQILADYSAIGGYVQGDPATDQGCDEETAFEHYEANGYADGTKLSGHLLLDPTNPTEIKQAIDLFESGFFGVGLPSTWISPFPSSSGFVWDVGVPNANNGHAFVAVGYNDAGIQIDTWGLIGTITWPAVAALCGQADGGQLFVLCTPDSISKATGKSPLGMDWATMASDFTALNPRGGMS